MQSTKRPKGVWVIVIFYALSVAWTLLSLWLVYSKRVPVPVATAEYLNSLSALEHAYTAATILLMVAFLVSLFLMRRVAVTIFTIYIALNGFSFLWSIVFRNFLSSVTVASLVGTVFAWAILVVVYLYLRRLVRDVRLV